MSNIEARDTRFMATPLICGSICHEGYEPTLHKLWRDSENNAIWVCVECHNTKPENLAQALADALVKLERAEGQLARLEARMGMKGGDEG
jgi:Zn-finger protein